MQGKRPEVEDGEDMALLVALQLTYTNLIFIMDRQSVWDYTQQKVWKGRLEEIQNPHIWRLIGEIIDKGERVVRVIKVESHMTSAPATGSSGWQRQTPWRTCGRPRRLRPLRSVSTSSGRQYNKRSLLS
jgi:hypothetical protein